MYFLGQTPRVTARSYGALKTETARIDLSELTPISGFTKGQSASSVQPTKSATPVSKTTANADADALSNLQPVQQIQQSAVPSIAEYERNSMAIKLSNNPLANLTGLQEAVGSVLDEPVSQAAHRN